MLSQYAEVLNGNGELPGHYTIHTNPEVVPVVHPPRRLPISLQDNVKAELEEMVKNNIITPVTKQTQWVSSMVGVQKKNKKIRICLDPWDLNKGILRSLPTIEQVTSRLNKAKVFTILDAKTGFWQVKLDD